MSARRRTAVRRQLELTFERGRSPVRPSLENRVALTRELAPVALAVLEREGAPRDKAAARPDSDDARHVAHCCSNHGCAYDGDDCPIEALRLRQRSACGAAAPCERQRAPKLPPRPLDLRAPCPPRDPREQHLTGGVSRGVRK